MSSNGAKMRTPSQYLDELKEKTGSDYKTAQLLGLTVSAISKIRSRELMSDETALKVATGLKIDPDEVLIAATVARSDGLVKSAWLAHAKKAGIAASTLLAIGLATYTTDTNAQLLSNAQELAPSHMYIMSNYMDCENTLFDHWRTLSWFKCCIRPMLQCQILSVIRYF